jgi:ATP-binding cassette subfamily B protein
VLDRLFYYFRRFKLRYGAGFLLLVSASVIVMVTPVVVREAIDSIVQGTTRGQLARYFGLIIAIAVVESCVRLTARQLISGTSRRVEYELRNDLAEHLMKLDQSYYVRSQTGDIMARVTNDLQRVRDLAGPAALEVGRAILMMAVAFAFMLSINVRLALIALAYFPAIAFLMLRFRTRVENKYREVQDQFGEISNRVQENISGIRAIKAYAQEESEALTFARANRELMDRTMSWALYMGAFWPLMIFVAGASVALVLWVGGHDVVAGRLTIGEFVQFNAYLAILANPLMSLGWTLTMFQQGLASWRRVAQILMTQPRIADPSQPVRIDAPRGEIEFRDLTFGYYDEPVLRGVNLRIPAGQTVALVGGTGAGKTTLVGLLVRLYDPWQGQVLLDGVDVRELSLSQLRELVGFVPQETFLFSESLRENIALAREGAGGDDIEYAVETSQLVNDLPQLTGGLDTVLGERGVTLSGGQKQRTALARALVKDPPIVVLDDALSHVDTHTEEAILQRLGQFMRGRTTILIAHRTSTLASADRIVVLEGGRVSEEGTHQQLLERAGLYARFFQRQLLAEQVEAGDGAAPSGNHGEST